MPAGPQETEPSSSNRQDSPCLMTNSLSIDSFPWLARIMGVDNFWVWTFCSFFYPNKIPEGGPDLRSLGQVPAHMGTILFQGIVVGEFPEEEK